MYDKQTEKSETVILNL